MTKLYLKYVNWQLDNFHIFLVIASIFLWAADFFGYVPGCTRYGYMLFCFTALSWLLHLNQKNLYRYMNMNRNVSHLPIRQIQLINTLFLTFYLGLTGLLMYLLPKVPYEKPLHLVIRFFRIIIGAFLRLIIHNPSPVSADEPLYDTSSFADFGLSYKTPNSLLIKVIEFVLKVIGILLILWLAYTLLRIIYQKIASSFHLLFANEAETREFIMPEMKHEKLSRDGLKKEKRLFTDLSPNGRIRKLYIRSIRKLQKKEQLILRSSTPHEIECSVELEQNESSYLLHQTYEKARYSKDGCTSSDFTTLKKELHMK